eukprot:TRINITY_DN776172_c0_g1_i1.p1 TRINITY_DN776172_c0_g1~~TRINITY_DN776172_c0_g1_i1.p1  ORF type:complete len:236 (+),score=64.87 TRINITY_DN776172_c0_g1_i1:51-758(+)
MEETAVSDFLSILEQHRKNCEKQGKYVEAEIAKNRLEELKLHEENRKREIVKSRHIAERLGVEEAHMLEFQQFNEIWDQKMEEYEEQATDLLQTMKERHIMELQKFQEELIGKPARPKFSKELLNLRRIEECLARRKDYAEAAKVKMRCDELEAREAERCNTEKQSSMHNAEKKFVHKQSQEMNALRKRIQTGKNEQKKQRQVDLERLLQRYQNVKSELQQQHSLEWMRMEKSLR